MGGTMLDTKVHKLVRDLEQAEAALRAFDQGSVEVLIRFNTAIDPATGRHEADTLRIGRVGAGDLRSAVIKLVKERRGALAAALRAAADEIEAEAEGAMP